MAALTNEQKLADVELIVKDKTFFVHKAVLAARSQVFAEEFKKIPLLKAGSHRGSHLIRIDDVEPKTVEKFLYFIYTGESIGTLADEELLKLADRYGLTTLTILCQDALKKIDAMQMGNLMKCLNSINNEEISSSKIM
jgi:speckle-type POZ protein